MNSILEDWNLHNPLYFFDSFLNHDFRNNSLHNLRNFHNLFNNSGHHNNLFNNSLYLHNFWNLYHLFDDLLNWHLDLFNSINMSEHLDNLFLNVLNRLWHFNIMVNNLFNLNCLWFSHDNWFSNIDDNGNLPFNCLNDGFLDVFSYFDYFLVNHWNLYDSIDFPRHLLNDFHNHFNNPFDLFNSINHHNFLNDHLNCIRSFNHIRHLNYFFDHLRYLHNSLFSLNNDHRSLYNSIDNHMSHFNMVFYLFSSHNLNLLYDFLHYLFNFHYLWNTNYLLNYLLHNDWNFNYLFNYLFNSNNLLFNNLHFSVFGLDVVDDLSDWNCLFNFNISVNILFNYLNFRHFSDNFNYSFNDGRNFNSFFDYL